MGILDLRSTGVNLIGMAPDFRIGFEVDFVAHFKGKCKLESILKYSDYL